MTAARTAPVAAVIVLAAGEGTRMRSATPKVLHAIGGRTLLGHVLAAAGTLDPEHLVVVVGHGREAVAEHLAAVAPDGPAGRPGGAARHRARRPGRPGGAARRSTGTVVVVAGDTPLLTGRDPGPAGRRPRRRGRPPPPCSSAVLDDPTGLRPDPARRRRRGGGHRRAEGRRRGPARGPRDQQRDLRLRRRRPAPRRWPSSTTRQRPGRGVPHRRRSASCAPQGRPVAARRRGRPARDPRASTTACSSPRPAGCCATGSSRRWMRDGRHRRRPGDHLDRRRRRARPRRRRAARTPSCSARPLVGRRRRGRPGHHPAPTAVVGEGAHVVRSARRPRGDRRGRQRRPVHLPAARHRARRRRQERAPSSRRRTPSIGEGTKVPHLSYVGDADDRRGHQHRRGHASSSTTTAWPSTARPSATTSGSAATRCSSPRSTVGDGAYTGGRLGDHRGRAARARWPSAGRGSATIEGWVERKRGRARPRRRPPARPGTAAGQAWDAGSAGRLRGGTGE